MAGSVVSINNILKAEVRNMWADYSTVSHPSTLGMGRGLPGPRHAHTPPSCVGPSWPSAYESIVNLFTDNGSRGLAISFSVHQPLTNAYFVMLTDVNEHLVNANLLVEGESKLVSDGCIEVRVMTMPWSRHPS